MNSKCKNILYRHPITVKYCLVNGTGERTQVSFEEVFNNYILPNATDITGSVKGLINKGSTDITVSIGKEGVLVADTKMLNKAIWNYLSGLSYFGSFLNEFNSFGHGYGMMFDGEGGNPPGGNGEKDNNYCVNLLETTQLIQDIFKAFHIALKKGNLTNLYDIIISNGYSSGYFRYYTKLISINGFEYKISVHGYSSYVNSEYYDIYQTGFGYLDRSSKHKIHSNLFNGGYSYGFYITGYYRNYLITIGSNTSDGYLFLMKMFHSYD